MHHIPNQHEFQDSFFEALRNTLQSTGLGPLYQIGGMT